MNAKMLYSVLFVLTVSIFGCDSKSSLTPDQGGTSGGGGNTVASRKIDTNDLKAAISNAKPVVVVWLTLQKNKCDFLCGSLYNRLFAATPNILEAAKNLHEVELRSESCRDERGGERDASIYGKKAGTICLSSSRLLARLNNEDHENQVAALIIHELSHFAGASEADALEIQKDFLSLFSFEFEAKNVSEAYVDMMAAVRGFDQNINILNAIASGEDFDGDCLQLSSEIPQYFNLILSSVASYRRTGVFSAENQKYLNAAMTKIYAAADFVCGMDFKVSSSERLARKALYQSYFALVDQMSAKDYPTRHLNGSEASVIIHKITDHDSYARELKGAIDIIARATEHLQDLNSSRFQVY
ncbi:hypothetical protein ACLVWU_06190 [Bdellovibrio sp. HCB290]|uniref:hypothetical protein n=1 Tax=Bdellovibrio sp. HCB290 TaxID=3394356 RepID=UPI0039B4E4D8